MAGVGVDAEDALVGMSVRVGEGPRDHTELVSKEIL